MRTIILLFVALTTLPSTAGGRSQAATPEPYDHAKSTLLVLMVDFPHGQGDGTNVAR
jgi:hypothetical protein